jgi:hypothetical protein
MPISRRYFFYGSLLAGAVPTGGYGSVASLQALGHKPYYNKLRVAAIGCGGQGGGILNQAAQTESVAALCDVDEARAASTFKRYEKVPKYKDFRVMLDKEAKNIDACTIGIPDFMHAPVALACMQRGLHVYVEKPLTRTVWEARLLQDAAVKYKVATQMGNQGFSHECNRVAAEIVWSGAIGDVLEAHVTVTPGTHPTSLTEPPPEEKPPSSLDWELWLAAAAYRPFSSWYVPYNWRGFYDFGTGQIGNWATHTAGPVHTALQLEAPTSIERVAVEGPSKLTFPKRAVIRLDFPARGAMPPVKVFYHDGYRPDDPGVFAVPGMENETILPPTDNLAEKGRPTGMRGLGRAPGGFGGQRGPSGPGGPGGPLPAARAKPTPGELVGAGGPGVKVFLDSRGGPSRPGILSGNGAVFIGTKGVLATSSRGEGVHLLPAARWKDYTLPPQLLTRSPGHMLDWVRACKGGEPSCSDFRVTGPYAEWLALAALAFRLPGRLDWDARNLRFTNSPEANQYVKPVFRKGWELKL